MARKRRSGTNESQGKKKKKIVKPRKRPVIKRPGDKKDRQIKIKTSLHKRLKIMAAVEDKQISDLVEELLTTPKKLRNS